MLQGLNMRLRMLPRCIRRKGGLLRTLIQSMLLVINVLRVRLLLLLLLMLLLLLLLLMLLLMLMLLMLMLLLLLSDCRR